MQFSILLVEDQAHIRDVVVKYLQREGYHYYEAKDGFEALNIYNEEKIHLIILDIMLPGIDGFEVLEKLRKISDVPVIFLTAKQSEIDRIKGFDIGADDYVVKPFSSNELMRRIKAIIKRAYNEEDEIVYKHKNLILHTKNMTLYKGQEKVTLTAAEYNLLLVLFKNKGIVLTREQLINKAFGLTYDGYDRNIDSYIKRLRNKIENNPHEPEILLTKYGAGYIFGGLDDN